MYYDYRKIEGYNAPINVIISKRGLGKTFGRVLKCVRRFYEKKIRFIYVVETDEMVDELSQASGEKFFASIRQYLENKSSKRNKKLLDFLTKGSELKQEESIFTKSKLKGGTIYVGNEIAGYIVSLNGFARLKRNNFVNVGEIIIDEFIPENIDIRSLKNAYKMISIVQSIARTSTTIKIYLLANAIRLDDTILVKLKLTNLKMGEFRTIYDKYGLLLVCHYVDPNEYKDFNKVADKSVAGRLASLTGEDNLERNEFINQMPKELEIPHDRKSSHLYLCLHGEYGSVRLNITKDRSQFYVMEDYGTNTTYRYCVDRRYQSPVVIYRPEFKDILISYYTKKMMLFENSQIFEIFKKLLNLSWQHNLFMVN